MFLYEQRENSFHLKMQKTSAALAIKTIFESSHHVEQIYNSCQAIIPRSTSGAANKSQRTQTHFSKMLSA